MTSGGGRSGNERRNQAGTGGPRGGPGPGFGRSYPRAVEDFLAER
jgi:hypothetical protein